MKNILFLLSILLGVPVVCLAQKPGEFLQHLFAPLGKSEITSGFLMDQGLNGLTDPSVFDGTLRDSVFLQPATFGFLYAQLRDAYVGAVENPLPAPGAYMDYVSRYAGTDTVPLAALALRYHRVHYSALDDNLFRLQDEQLFDVPSRPKSPYWQDTLLAFAPLKADAWHTTVHFILPVELIWQNLGWSAPLFQADFGDGQGWRTLTPGQIFTVSYPCGGAKTIRTRVSQNFINLEVQSVFYVMEPPVEERGSGPNYPISEPESITPIPGGGGDLRVFYGSPCNKLLKPFILVEGFELVDNPDQFTERLKRLMKANGVITSNPEIPLGEWLYAQGYDIVWVNMTNIQDYIQNNAEVLKAAVQKINEIKALNGSSEPNLIMGVSAGGIITKYMLVKTNTTPFDHQCEKFFSYDAPLRGANIPLSVQCLLHHVNYIASSEGNDLLSGNPSVGAAFNALTSPFARQTLLYRFFYPATATSSEDGVVSGEEYEAFMAEMDALGPIPIRHIALSNGSAGGTDRANISPGSRMFTIESSGSAFAFSIPPSIPTFIDVSFRADGHSLPSQENQLVYFGDFSIEIQGGLIRKDFYCNVMMPESGKDYDTAPGGSSNIAILALMALNGTPVPDIPVPPIFSNGTVNVPMSPVSVSMQATHYCFIPTFSSISAGSSFISNGPFSCGQGTSDRCSMNSTLTSLPSPPYPSSLSNPEINQDHVYLDSRIGDIIVDEADIAHLEPSGQLPASPDPLIVYYNAGLPRQSALTDLVISSSEGKLSINNTGNVGYNNGPVSPDNYYKAYTRCGNITVERDAQLVVGADGGVKHGVLNITPGSTVHIRDGGILRVTSSQSELIVKSGAHLILDPGARVILDDPESRILIEGELVWNGDITFSGKGYFAFENGHTLTFGPEATRFYLNGQPFHRCVRVRDTELTLPEGIDFVLDQGGVEYRGPSAVRLGAESKANCKFVRFYDETGDASVGLKGFGAGDVDIFICKFDGVGEPFHLEGGNGYIFGAQDWVRVSKSKIERFNRGMYFADRNNVIFEQCDIDCSNTDHPYGLYSDQNFGFTLRGCTVYGMGNGYHGGISSEDLLTNGDLKEAVRINGGFIAWMDGGSIANCDIGIGNRSATTPGWDANQTHIHKPINLIVSKQATLENCVGGVVVEGDDQRGLIVSSCARYILNNYGIAGRDLRLLIDPELIAPNALVAPMSNAFVREASHAGSDRYIDICYNQSEPGGISVANNYWGTPDYQSGSGYMAVSNPAPGITLTRTDNCGADQPFAWSPVINYEPRRCNEDPCPGGDCVEDCPVDVPGITNVSVRSQFLTGYEKIMNDQSGDAPADFQPLSDMYTDQQPDDQHDFCRAFILAANSLVAGSNDTDPQSRPDGRSRQATVASSLELAPNPATRQVRIALTGGISTLRVTDATGRVVVSQSLDGAAATQLDVSAWPAGLYSVSAWPTNGGKVQAKVLMVE